MEATVFALAVACAVASAGCDQHAQAGTPDAGTADASVADASAAEAGTPAPASAAPMKPSLQILKLQFTSDVKDKEPADKLEYAQPGQRVYVHLTMRNRTGDARNITVLFRVNNEERSKVSLKVESSWSYRTWAYNTLRAGDLTGVLSVEVRDEAGGSMTTQQLPIRQTGSGRPLPTPSKQ
jgi:hypothetical protein